jgi:hypothetical protein
MSITYVYSPTGSQKPIIVKLDGKAVGKIQQVAGGFRYMPAGSRTGGAVLPSVAAVQRSIESD